MLTDIFNQFGRPKELITDSGPAFLHRFHEFCQEFYIDHKLSAAYMAKTNGRAERHVGLVKMLIEKNSPVISMELDSLICALNNRVASIMMQEVLPSASMVAKSDWDCQVSGFPYLMRNTKGCKRQCSNIECAMGRH